MLGVFLYVFFNILDDNKNYSKDILLFDILENNYRIDGYTTIFKGTFYIISTFLLFTIIRILTLGKNINLHVFVFEKFSLLHIGLIIILLLNIGVIQAIIHKCLSLEIYKLHLYLLSCKYKNQYEVFNDFIVNTYGYCSKKFKSIKFDYNLIANPNLEYEHSLKDLVDSYNDAKVPEGFVRINKFELWTSRRNYILASPYLSFIYGIRNYIINLFTLTGLKIDSIIYYMPRAITFILFLYDLSICQVKYTYYGLLFLTLTQAMHKFRYFYYSKDPVYDNIISKYLYCGENKGYEDNPHTWELAENADLIRDYFKANMTVYYIIDATPDIDRIRGEVKKGYLLLALSISSLYIVNITTYNLLLLIPLVILYAIRYSNIKGFMVSSVTSLLGIIQILIISVVYIKRNLLLYMSETIWNWGITITQTFTIDEKLDFIQLYLLYFVSFKNLTIEEITFLIEILKHTDAYMVTFMSITEIKEDVVNLINNFMYLRDKYDIESKCNNLPEWFYALRNSLFIAGILQSGILLSSYLDLTIDIVYNFYDFSYKCMHIFTSNYNNESAYRIVKKLLRAYYEYYYK